MISEKASLFERFKYGELSRQEIEDALEELFLWQDAASSYHIDTPEELEPYIEELEGNQENPDHANYDDLKSFFDDCVYALNSNWPCAEPYDDNLRSVICNAITRGDVGEDEEEAA